MDKTPDYTNETIQEDINKYTIMNSTLIMVLNNIKLKIDNRFLYTIESVMKKSLNWKTTQEHDYTIYPNMLYKITNNSFTNIFITWCFKSDFTFILRLNYADNKWIYSSVFETKNLDESLDKLVVLMDKINNLKQSENFEKSIQLLM